jgi:hypothetical protein
LENRFSQITLPPPVGSLTLTKQTRQLRKRQAKEKPRKNSRFQMDGWLCNLLMQI